MIGFGCGRRVARNGAAALLAALALTGCGSSRAPDGAGPSAAGASPTERRLTETILFGGNPLPPPSVGQREFTCPVVSLLEGTGVFRAAGSTAAARGVTTQVTIEDYARECRAEGGTMRVKLGVSGRVLLGESGKPGPVSVPIRVVVRKGGVQSGQTVSSKLATTTATILPNDTQASFVVIDESIAVPIGALDPGEEYSILVGLDPQGAPRERRRRR